jgi:AcrR family transcriptional regulator
MLPVTTYHHGDLRAAVLRTAAKMLDEDGLESLSFREIARRAGVSHNAPYRHFPDRDSLLVALACEGFDLLRGRLEGIAPSRLAGEFTNFALDRPALFRLMSGGTPPSGRHKIREKSDALFATLRRALGDVGETPYAVAAAWSFMSGLAHLMLDGSLEKEEAAAGGRPRFVDAVSGAVRFVVKAQRSA